MKATTYFLAYQETHARMLNAIPMRKYGLLGIAIEDDEWALHWQRAKRLKLKLEARLWHICQHYDSAYEIETFVTHNRYVVLPALKD